LPITSLLFKLRRIYEKTNHLWLSDRNGGIIGYGIAKRDKVAARLIAGEDLTFAEIKRTFSLDITDKVNMGDS